MADISNEMKRKQQEMIMLFSCCKLHMNIFRFIQKILPLPGNLPNH